MPHLDANGLRFHVQVLAGRQAGPHPARPHPGRTRPAVVMIHGLVVDNLSSWFHTIANPVALVADTYLYDLRGHGRTEVPPAGYTVADHVGDLGALLDAWGLDGPVHLVANSFGGAIALAFADRCPERVASLVLIEAHFATEGWGEHMAGSLALAAFGLDEQNVRDWLGRNAHRKLRRLAHHAEHLFERTSLIDDLKAERPFPRRALAAIGCPTLAIYGEGSDILDRAHDLARHVPGCELHVLPGVDHSVLTEATRTVRSLIVGRLSGDPAPAPAATPVPAPARVAGS